VERIDVARVPLDVAQSSSGTHGNVSGGQGNAAITGSVDTAPSYPQDVVALEKPVVRRLRIAADVALGPDGRGTVRRSASVYLAPGKEIVVVVEVK
jgi:hypothetical protein